MNKDTKIVKLKLDIIFKRIFGDEKNKRWLAKLVSVMLGIPYDSIEEITIENNEVVPDYLDQKFSRLDFKIRVNNDIINIELQVHYQKDYAERTLFYWSKIFSEQLKAGEVYGKLEKTICINIINFNYLPGDDYYSSYKIMEETRHDILTNKFSILFFELKKLNKNRKNRPIEEWLDLINAETEGDLDMIETTTKDTDIHDIIYKIRELSGDEKLRYEADLREKRLHDEASIVESARDEGRAEGRAEGLAKGESIGLVKGRAEGLAKGLIQGAIQVIDGLLAIGMDIDKALNIAHISREDYDNYKNNAY